MEKRISSRGIIIEDNYLYSFFRRRINNEGVVREYYSQPGGGRENNETLEQNLIRELKEEFCVDIRINGYVGLIEDDNSIQYFFKCEITSGIPTLGGEELERFCDSNYYEIKKIDINDLDNIEISNKDIILKAYNNEFDKLIEA